MTEVLFQPKAEIDGLKSQLRSVVRQIGDQKDEVQTELSRLKTQGVQLNSQLLLKAEKTEVEGLSKRLDARLTAFKQEWAKQAEAVSGQIAATSDSVSAVKIGLSDEIGKSSRSLIKKQDLLCEKLIELEGRVCQVGKDSSDQAEEILKLVKGGQTSTQTAMHNELDALRSELDSWKASLSSQLDLKLNSTEMARLKKQLKEAIAAKASADEVNQVMEKFAGEMNAKQAQLQAELERMLDLLKKELTAQLRKKLAQKDVEVLLAEKVGTPDFEGSLNPIIKRLGDLEDRTTLADKKAKARQAKMTALVQSEVGRVEQSCAEKVTPADLTRLIERKANIDDFNSVLASLQSQIHAKADSEDIQKLVAEQEQFNEFFSTESILARYKWKSGQFGNTPFVPLEIECLNTLKENFIWEKNSTSLVVLNGGLYEVAFGFFSKQRPSAKLYFNNEVVCSCGGFPSQDTTKALGMTTKVGAKDREREKEKQLGLQKFPSNGLTSFDYYLVPDNCRISLYVIGESIVEGFINIRRL